MLAARPAHLVAALCLFYCVAAQGGNYVDDGGFDYAEPAQPSRAAPRPAAAYRPTSSLSASASGPKPTPVPILKQINRHNEDGSYTYGYEGADGAFKIETKLANGEVMGKYGYVDDTGNVRVVEYGANKYGFQPAGEGITVPPPTLVDESAVKKSSKSPLESKESVEYDDGQYYEEAPRAAPPPPPVRQAPRPAPRPSQRVASRPVPQPQFAPDDTYSTFSSTQNFGPSRPVSFGPSSPSFDPSSRSFGPSSPSFGPSSPSFGPAPPRAAVAGAVPVGPPTSYSQPRALSAPPRPVSRPQPQPQPQQSFFNPASAPAPVYESRPVAAAAPSSSRGGFGRSSSILDQLEKDFALPSNSAPALHDITFGSSY